MILAHPQMQAILELSNQWVSTLVVEEPNFYRKFLLDLYGQLEGEEGQLVLSEKNTVLSIRANVELLDNCLQFDMNRKLLLGKIGTVMERTAVSESFFLRTSEMLCQLETYMDELAFSLPCDVIYEKCTVAGLIKAMGIRVRDDYEDPLERLLDYMELVREFDKDKLFIIVGLRSFFSSEALARFAETVVGHGYKVLLLDSVEGDKFPLEQRLTIDKDLCEF